MKTRDQIYSEAYEPDDMSFIAFIFGELIDEKAKTKMELLELENFLFVERIEIAKNYIKRGNIKTVKEYFDLLNKETEQFKNIQLKTILNNLLN